MSLYNQPARSTSIYAYLWVHNEPTKPDIVFNVDLFQGSASPGDLVELTPLKSHSSHEALHTLKNSGYNTTAASAISREGGDNGKRPALRDADELSETNHSNFLFIVPKTPLDDRTRQSGLQISIAQHIANKFKLTRSNVKLTLVDKSFHEASHVEITFKDQYLARSDMWRLAANELADHAAYAGQKLNFVGSIKAQIQGIWIRGQKVQAAYFSSKTRPIFRSLSARFVLFVQMSKEMWHFETEGKGEILFNKMINGFLPELFKRWKRLNAHHLVSIVLFTRIVYDGEEQIGVLDPGDETTALSSFNRPLHYRDFFRVVVSHRESEDWTVILHQLKKEFSIFLRDVLVQPTKVKLATHFEQPISPGGLNIDTGTHFEETFAICGEPSTSIQGNILEAINLACNQFSKDHVDRDLVRTGISIIIISPGTGHFEVDYDMLQMTTENLVANGIGIDLVCLSRPPLHSTPLFKYKNPNLHRMGDLKSPIQSRSRAGTLNDFGQRERRGTDTTSETMLPSARRMSNATIAGKLADAVSWGLTEEKLIDTITDEYLYAVPHWIDVSFWSNSSERKSRHHRMQAAVRSRASNITGISSSRKDKKSTTFKPRCKMYELQMMGVMENEVANIAIPFLHDHPLYIAFDEPHETKNRNTGRESLLSEDKKKTDRGTKPHQAMIEYMEKYDDFAFKSLSEVTRAQEDAKLKRIDDDQQRIDEIVREDPNVLSTSFRSTISRRSHAPNTGVAYFDRKMKERRPSLESPDEPKDISPSGEEHKKEAVRSPQQPVVIPSIVTQDESKNEAKEKARAPGRLSGFKVFGLSAKGAPAAPSTSTTATNNFPILTRGFTPAAVTAKTSLTSTATGYLSNAIFSPDLYIRNTSSTSVSQQSSSDRRDSDSRSLAESSPVTLKPTRPIAIRNSVSEVKEAEVKPRLIANSPTERRQAIALHEGKILRSGGQIDILKAASQARTAAPRLDLTQSAGQMSSGPVTNPTSFILPWLTILNPSNPKKAPVNPKNQFRRWQHVFPRPLRVSTMKWKSLCSPAALPLTTEYFPTLEQLANEYSENPYSIAPNDDDDVEEFSKNRKELVREMVSQRLSRGFQIVVGAAVQEAMANAVGEPDIFALGYMGKGGSSIYMSMGPHIHQIICDEEFNIQVKRHTRKLIPQKDGKLGVQPIAYDASIRTVLSDTYEPLAVEFRTPQLDYYWNYVDRYIGGYEDDFIEPMRFWRARFVLIPVDLPPGAGPARRQTVTGIPQEDMNDEEIRLEGIQKLTQLFQRHRYVPPEERRYIRSRKEKDDNPLEIIFKTANPSVVVAKEVESLPAISEAGTTARRQHLIMGSEMFERNTMKLVVLAQELQGPRGIRLQDRRWHLRLHYNCFIGSEFVTWILLNFKDIDTREEAVEYGNDLMKDKLFHHVEKRHAFRDGNFFYQLGSEYVSERPSTWNPFGGRRSKNPGTPGDPSDLATPPARGRSPSVVGDMISGWGGGDPFHTTPPIPKQRTRVALSKVMKYNMDPSKKSYRPEIVNLHYDRVHNPENCYHIRIEWLNVTAKLIEDALSTWAKSVQRYGLKLVEAPIDEICAITANDSFRSPLTVRLSLPPPNYLSLDISTTTLSTCNNDIFQYHDAILKKFGFILDTESAKNFPPDVEVTYSWGKPCYKYTQYIHRTGLVFAQITDLGDFLLLANRLFSQRGTIGDSSKFENTARDDRRNHSGHDRGGANSNTGGGYTGSTYPHAPPSSFMINSANLTSAASQQSYITAEMIKSELQVFCKDTEKLQAFYEEFDSKRVTTIPPTPQVEPLSASSSAILGPTFLSGSIFGGGSGFMSPATGMGVGREPVSPAMLALGSISSGNASTSSISTLTGNKSTGSILSGDARSTSQGSGMSD